MTEIKFDQFGGLETQGDDYSVEGSPDSENVEIDLYGDINKAKGYAFVGGTTRLITSVSKANPAVLTIETGVVIPAGSIIFIDELTEPEFSAILSNKAWKVLASPAPSATSIALYGANTSGVATIEALLKSKILFDDKTNISSLSINYCAYNIPVTIRNRTDLMFNAYPNAFPQTYPEIKLLDSEISITLDKKIFSAWVVPNYSFGSATSGEIFGFMNGATEIMWLDFDNLAIYKNTAEVAASSGINFAFAKSASNILSLLS